MSFNYSGLRRTIGARVKNYKARIQSFGSEKIFCIGFNKTGTTSLLTALEDFGYVFGNLQVGETLLDAYAARDFRPIIDFCQGGNAFKDVPLSLPFTFIPLHQAFPKSKFILTIRDSAEQWYSSITQFHKVMFAAGQRVPTYADLTTCSYCKTGWALKYIQECYNTPASDPYQKDLLVSSYNKHIDDVLFYFRNSPEKLIVINVAEKESYLNLCSFLGRDPLYDAIPWKNKTSEKLT
jgi:hypothetical protein